MTPEIVKWVRIVVLKTVREKRLAHLDVDNLISAGFFGYSQAIKRYDPTRGAKLKTFAEYRIRGAVLDEVRKMIGDERCKNKRPTQVDDFDMTQIEGNGNSIESVFDVERFFDQIPLDKRSKLILKARIEGLNLREIGEKFGFSESRASQLLADIKKQVYPWFEKYLGVNFKLIKCVCPKCGHKSEAAEFTTIYECEKCCAEMSIKDGRIILEEAGNA